MNNEVGKLCKTSEYIQFYGIVRMGSMSECEPIHTHTHTVGLFHEYLGEWNREDSFFIALPACLSVSLSLSLFPSTFHIHFIL